MQDSPAPLSCRSAAARSRGFTLTELLAVLAVLTLLAATLMPVMSRARDRAWQAHCASNLAQIARGGLMYLQDHDDYFPPCYVIASPPYAVDPLISLQPYLKNVSVLYCPERHTVRYDCLDPTAAFRPNSRCMGYGYNWGSGLGWGTAADKQDGLIRKEPGSDHTSRGVAWAEVVVPAHCFFYGDTNDDYFLTLLRDAMPGVRRDGNPNANINNVGLPYEPPRHSGGNNFAFVDGHLQWLAYTSGVMADGGPQIVTDMSMYSRTGQWEPGTVP